MDKTKSSKAKEEGLGAGALIWKLDVFLGQGIIHLGKKKYAITVECTGIGSGDFTFKAHDNSRELSLDAYRLEN